MLDDGGQVDDLAERRPVGRLLGEQLEQAEVAVDVGARAVGRCTLTTTRSPLSSVARCTWPIVPAASGCGSIDSNTSSQGTPSSCSITETTSASVIGVTRSWSVASSSTNSGGSRSGRVERIWPSFAKVGPSSSSAGAARARSLERRDAVGVREQISQAVLGEHAADLGRAAEELALDVRPGARRLLAHRSRREEPAAAARLRRCLGAVDDDDRAARIVRDAVRHVPEQELLAAAHADVADDEHVGAAPRRRPRRSPARAPRRRRPGAPAIAGELLRETLRSSAA